MKTRVCITAIHDFQYNSNPLDLAEVLARHGFDVDVYARFADAGVHANRGFRCLPLPGRSDAADAVYWLSRTVGRYEVYIGINSTGLFLSLLARGAQVHGLCVYYALELEAPGHAVGFARMAARVRRRGLRCTDIIVATGAERAHLLKTWFPMVSTTLVLPNAPLREPLAQGGLRQRLEGRLPSDAHIVLYHGSVVREAAIDTILTASSRWAAGAYLVVMGFGDPALVEMIRDEGAARGRVLLMPPIATGRLELLRSVADASVGLVLYRHKGQYSSDPNLVFATPNKLFDFMAAGVPVVCSDNPSLVRVEKDGWGICVDPDDADAVSRAVDQCLAEQRERSAVAVRLFRSEYHYSKAADELALEISRRVSRSR